MFPQAQVHGVSGRGWPHSPQNLPVLEVPQPGQVHALPGCETDTIEQYVPLAENYWEKDSATDVFCYSEPIDPAEVETITAYRFAFAGEDSDGTSGLSGYDLTDRTVIYSAQ